MSIFDIWAPNAKKIELLIRGNKIPLHSIGNDWFSGDAPLEHRTDYQLYVDDEGPFPDPRSPWQPEGPHGPSRWLDHNHFVWTDFDFQARPLSSALIYELHIGTFTPEGTFTAAIDKLDHLVELGVTHIELMPVNEFPGSRGWGYDGVDLFAPHHAYGGPKGLKQLVDACHHRGLAVLLDVVYNHLGPSGNYLSKFGPYFTNKYGTPWGEAVNLDGPGSHEVRRFFIDNALMWMHDYHIDGLRIDAVHAIFDMSAVHFLEQMAREVDVLASHLGRNLVLIAESNLNDTRHVLPFEANGYGLDAQWNDDFHHALHTLLTGERGGYYEDFGDYEDLAKALEEGFIYDGGYSSFRNRLHGRSGAMLSAHKFIGFLQNHDQVGNRATGDRTSHLLTTGQLKIGAAMVLLGPFVPMLFQGEEWGASTPFQYFTDHEEPELADAVREGRRSEFKHFGWKPEDVPDPQAEETFLNSKLSWDDLADHPHAELLEWHKALVSLRRTFPELTSGDLPDVVVEYDEDDEWFTMTRGRIRVICNLASDSRDIPLPVDELAELLLVSNENYKVLEDGYRLPGQSVAVALLSGGAGNAWLSHM